MKVRAHFVALCLVVSGNAVAAVEMPSKAFYDQEMAGEFGDVIRQQAIQMHICRHVDKTTVENFDGLSQRLLNVRMRVTKDGRRFTPETQYFYMLVRLYQDAYADGIRAALGKLPKQPGQLLTPLDDACMHAMGDTLKWAGK